MFKNGIVINKEECTYLEESTRLQAQSLLWFKQRVGRITASKFLAVKRASLNSPPAYLIKQLMERSPLSNSIPALQWGTIHEDVAREVYLELESEKHTNFQYLAAGLHVNPNFPHLGATPDGIIKCDCCGEGLIEIKCPYKHRDKHPHHVDDTHFYLKKEEDGRMSLCHNHDYFYQIQGQLAVCEKEYCDFICWTPEGIHVERILPDTTHFAETKCALDAFFLQVILPLLLTGKWTQMNINTQASQKTSGYCWCGGEDIGRMVACDNPTCKLEWFHYKCVGLKRKPKGEWYCSDICRRQ